MKVIKRHKKLFITLLIVVIAASAGLTIFLRTRKNDSEAKEVKQNTVSLGRQTLTKSISATGTIESKATKTVSASVNEMTVKKVKVKVGDSVKKGQKLVTFDKSDLKKALKEAKESLADAKSEASDSIASAKEQLADAKEAYSDAVAQAKKTKQQEAKAKAQQKKEQAKAKKQQKQAKQAVTKAKKKVATLQKKLKTAKTEQQKKSIEEQITKAHQELEQAQTTYQNLTSGNGNSQTTSTTTTTTTGSNGSGSDSTSQAKSNVQSAQNNLKNAQSSAEKSIKEAEKQVEEAEENLEKCAVVAPISGIVTSVGVEDGSTYSGGTMFQIDDTSSFTVSTTVDEYDISNVSVGQKAVILTEATDEEEIGGEISFVAPSTSSTSSTTSSSSSSGGSGGGDSMSSSSSSDGYEVVIKITDKNDKLKMGMTAKCSIILEQAENVFAVPYDAIHKDSDKNDVIYVAKSESDTSNYTEVKVTKGMESDYYVEITGDDLEEGMLIVIPTDETESKSDSSDSSDSNAMLPGGGMGGMGGNGGGDMGGGHGNRGGNGGGQGGPPGN